jgi:uncharacterized iron-regulated membrane protein
VIYKKIIRRIHLWLGLASSPVIILLGITGCLLAFQREIENATQQYRYVAAQKKEFLPPSKLKDIGKMQLPDKHLHAVLYEGREKAAQVIFYDFLPEEYYYVVYVNPYDGQVLKVKNMNVDFFRVVLMGHFYLWLPPAIGQPIIASATLVFVVMMISGLVLWWPKNKGMRKQRFAVKWNARWRRKNYDLHYVLGFYMTWVAIILAVTGLVWGFQWFAKAYYSAAGGEKEIVYQEPVSDVSKKINFDAAAIDVVWQKMRASHPDAEVIEVHIPDSDSAAIAANANPDSDTYWQLDYVYYDQYTLNELPAKSIYGRFRDADGADKLMRMNYDVHTGAIIGLPGKILMFFASLIAASLPVTGFIIWRGRRKKKQGRVALRDELHKAV